VFTHIFPGLVRTEGETQGLDFGWVFVPLTWILNKILWVFCVTAVHLNFCYSVQESRLSRVVSQEFCAEYMLYALLDGEKGVFIRNNTRDIVGSHVFDKSQLHIYDSDSDSPT
jgi:hypothetical protein